MLSLVAAVTCFPPTAAAKARVVQHSVSRHGWTRVRRESRSAAAPARAGRERVPITAQPIWHEFGAAVPGSSAAPNAPLRHPGERPGWHCVSTEAHVDPNVAIGVGSVLCVG